MSTQFYNFTATQWINHLVYVYGLEKFNFIYSLVFLYAKHQMTTYELLHSGI